MFKDEENKDFESQANIKIVGVGGGGNNSVRTMINSNIRGVEFIVANTDSQVLNKFDPSIIIHLGNMNDRKGLGAGAKPEIGREAALESEAQIKEKLKGADMVIISAGMGGGTGTGAAPIVAKVAKSMGALTIGIVTTPFTFEGPKRLANANDGIKALKQEVDSLIIISNNKLKMKYGSIPLKDSFHYADTVLKQTVQTMTDIISVPAHINLDFADVTTVMKDKGTAVVGIGSGNGKDRASKAAAAAISSPILESSVKGAKDMIVNITGGEDFSLDEIDLVIKTIQDSVGEDVNIIFGVSIDETKGKEVSVSVIATGLDENAEAIDPEKINIHSSTIEEKEEETYVSNTNEWSSEDTIEFTDLEEEELPSDDDYETDEFSLDEDEEVEESFSNTNSFVTQESFVEKTTDDIIESQITNDFDFNEDASDLDDEDLDSELPSFLKK